MSIRARLTKDENEENYDLLVRELESPIKLIEDSPLKRRLRISEL
jgi:hypothetical protein